VLIAVVENANSGSVRRVTVEAIQTRILCVERQILKRDKREAVSRLLVVMVVMVVNNPEEVILP